MHRSTLKSPFISTQGHFAAPSTSTSENYVIDEFTSILFGSSSVNKETTWLTICRTDDVSRIACVKFPLPLKPSKLDPKYIKK